MSRLDSMIRRLEAQRDILSDLAPRLGDIPGLVLEFGLGNGRTYDHLRQHLPDRRIVVFECVVVDGVLSKPSPEDFIIGDIRETASSFHDGCAALIHIDMESGVEAADAGFAAWLPGLVARLLTPGGYAASGPALVEPRLNSLPLPGSIAEGRYHVVRRR